MARSEVRRRPSRSLPGLGLGFLSATFGLGCSVLLPDNAAQCSTDADCADLGFEGATCDTSAGVCLGVDSTDDVGSGGTSVLSGGMSNGGDGSGGSASGGGSSIPSGGASGGVGSMESPTVRPNGSFFTDSYGGFGAMVYADTCPSDEVLVGLNVWTNPGSQYLQRSQALCGQIVVDGTTVSIAEGGDVRVRGLGLMDGADVMTELACGANEVVVGFDGRSGLYIDELRVHCAPLSAFADGDEIRLVVGKEVFGPSVEGNASGGEAFSAVCASGDVARGPLVAAGQWLDGFGLVCTTPHVAYPDGSACTEDADCKSGYCDTTCQPYACDAPDGCDCADYEGVKYVFCHDNSLHAEAQAACEGMGRNLARVNDHAENGWLRNTADSLGVNDFYVGASDAEVEGEWRWMDGEQFWQGGVDGVEWDFWAWHSSEPNNSGDCGYIAANANYGGRWLDTTCSLSQHFVCE